MDDRRLIFEKYMLIVELAKSEANVNRIIAKYNVDRAQAEQIIDRFNAVVVRLDNKDIFSYDDLDQLKQAIAKKETTKSKRQEEKSAVELGTKEVADNEMCTVYMIRNKAAAIAMGKRTNWCIAYDDSGLNAQQAPVADDEGPGENLFHYYAISQNHTIYYIFNKNKNAAPRDAKWSVLVQSNGEIIQHEFHDTDQKRQFSVQQRKNIFNYFRLSEDLFQFVPYTKEEKDFADEEYRKTHGIPPEQIEQQFHAVMGHLHQPQQLPQRDAATEQSYLDNKDFNGAVDYAARVIQGRWPELEQLMLQTAETYMDRGTEIGLFNTIKSMYEYARNIIRGRWHEAEKYIELWPEINDDYNNLFMYDK